MIFTLSNQVDKKYMEYSEGPGAITSCACCNKHVGKMKNCLFCGTVNCPQCLFKTRPYPVNNESNERRGDICLPCNKKFLYREAMR